MSKPKNYRFIVVDDEPIQLMMTKKIIHQIVANSEVETFYQPLTALEFIRQHYNFNHEDGEVVLLLDLHMPVMNGLQFLDLFKDFDNTLKERFKIFVVSFTSDESEIQAARNHPCVSGFYAKPFTKALLHDVLSKANIAVNLANN